MTAFNIDLITTDLPDLELRIYPRTNGELWDAPFFTTFEIDEAEIITLEKAMEK